MTQNMTTLYRKFYDQYAARYGPNTCILLLVGKFYELYDYVNSATDLPFTSARRAMELMNIALKERPNYGPNGELGIWGGVPEASLHKFAQVLTREGWTVVVVDQVKEGDSVVDRIPTRVLSPGTHIETATQDRMTVAYLWLTPQTTCTSIMDLTTGEVFSYETRAADDILHMLQVYGVRETLVSFAPSTQPLDEGTLRSSYGLHGVLHIQPTPERDNFAQDFAREEYLRRMFRIKSLTPVRSWLHLEGQSPALEHCICLLLHFLEDHFPQQAERLTSHEIYNPVRHMRLSNNILEQLNFITNNGQRSVLAMLQRTHSAIGARHLRERMLRPLTDTLTLETSWTQVEWVTQIPQSQRRELERSLKALYDIPRLHYKVAEGQITSCDVIQMYQSYSATICLIQNLRDSPLACPPELETQIVKYREKVRELLSEDKAARAEREEPVGFLTETAGPLTAEVETKIEENHQVWRQSWARFCTASGISIDAFSLCKKGDGDYVWEGARSNLRPLTAMRPSVQHGLTNFKVEQKKSGPITIECDEFSKFEHRLQANLRLLAAALRRESAVACDTLWGCVQGFQNAWVHWLGTIDTTLALACVAVEQKWTRPRIGDSLDIEGLRHPLLEAQATRTEYVRHSVSLGKGGVKGWLIYGVNASGKSSLMKAVGIAVLLAQAGGFVPADSMVLSPYDAAFSRIWSQDNLWAGLSSFAVEVQELREILHLATARSLVLGDEVCSGTESSSATALVASVLEHLDGLGTHFLFATHLHDLMKIPGFMPRSGIAVWHLKVTRTAEGKLIYDRTLQEGPGSCSYGLEVARAMGLPLSVMDRAYTIRRQLEGTTTAVEAPRSSWNSQIQRQICEICRSSFVPALEVHHITPRSQGGANHLRNLVVLCEACHDKHHAGQLEVGTLQVTSEGLERSTVPQTQASQPVRRQQSKERSAEEIELIRRTLLEFEKQPLTRVCLALEEHGIRITKLQLKSFIRSLPEQQ